MKIRIGIILNDRPYPTLAAAATPAAMASKLSRLRVDIVDGVQFGRPKVIQSYVNGLPIRDLTPDSLRAALLAEDLAIAPTPARISSPRPLQYQRTPGHERSL